MRLLLESSFTRLISINFLSTLKYLLLIYHLMPLPHLRYMGRVYFVNFTDFLKDLLTKHKVICAEFLEQNYDKVFTAYQRLLNSENYVTKRQSLKVLFSSKCFLFYAACYVQLLGELLLDRHNFTTMNHYISNPDNLKLMMNLLRDPSRNIQFEAFHVFKVGAVES